jgi:hypothetical protein
VVDSHRHSYRLRDNHHGAAAMIRRAVFWLLSKLLPYRRPDRGWVSLGITISNTSRKS